MKQTILDHFQAVDPILYKTARRINTPIQFKKSPNLFSDLCETIISQQLSTKAGDAICTRFRALFTQGTANPMTVSTLTVKQLRAIGISQAKATSIVGLAYKVNANELHLDLFETMADDEIRQELIQIRGIGNWTAEMFLMFSLGREDIFSYGDLGLRRAIQRLYAFNDLPNEDEMEPLVRLWSPYRSYASRILWNSLE